MRSEDSQLWKRYLKDNNLSDFHGLIERYQEWLQKIVKTLYIKYHVSVYEFSDYLHWGLIGLIESIKRYQIQDNADFKTFAFKRVRGEILNQINQSTEKIAQKSFQKKEMLKARIVSLIDEDDSNDAFDQFYSVTMGVLFGSLLESELSELDDNSEALLNGVYGTQLATQLRSYLEKLPENERYVLNYHYFYHMRFIEIAAILGLSKSRVSQLHAKGLNRIKRQVGDSEFELML